MDKVHLTFTLGGEELVFLLGILGAGSIPGQEDDPTAGLSEREKALVLSVAERSLKARGFLEVTEGRPGVDPVVVALVGACIAPDVSFLVTCHTSQGEIEARYFHIQNASDVVVEHSFPEPGLHTFTALDDRKQIADGAALVLQLADQAASSCSPGTLRQTVLTETNEVIRSRGVEAAQEVLVAEGLERSTARELVRTVADPVTNGSVTKIEHGPDQVTGFATLEGANGLWMLIPNGSDSDPGVSVVPSSAVDVRMRLKTLAG